MKHSISTRSLLMRALLPAGLVSAVSAGTAHGQQAYFSLTGIIDAADADQAFGVDFSRDITSADNPQFKTFHHTGGTNAAGQVIAAGSFDPLLNLRDTFSSIVDVTNDDGGPGLDAFIAYSGNGNTGDNLDGLTLPNQIHTLELQKFSAGAAGAWAVDILGPADATSLWTPSASANSSITDVIFGSNGAEGTDPALLRLNRSSDYAITGQLIVAKTGQGLLQQTGSGAFTVTGLTTIEAGGDAEFNAGTYNADGGLTLSTVNLTPFTGATATINGGSVVVGGQTNIQSGATFTLTAGGFTANEDVVVDGGTLTASTSAMTLAAGKSITVRNNGQFNHDPGFVVSSGQTFITESGGDATFKGFFGLATAGDGLIRSTGAGSTFNIDSNFNTFWATSGNTATLEVLDEGAATIDFAGDVDFARSTDATTTGVITVNSGGDLTFANTKLTLAEDDSTSTATVTVAGAGSTITHTGSQELIIGGTSTGSATININDSGTYTTSTGLTTIAATGSVDVTTNGTFNAKGDLTITGGSLTSDATSTFDPDGNITVDGGTLDIDKPFALGPLFFLASGKSLTGSNGAMISTAGAVGPLFGQTVSLTTGAQYIHDDGFFVGGVNTSGTLTVSGSGTSFTANGLQITIQGGAGTVNVESEGAAIINGNLFIAEDGTNSSTNGILSITTGGDVTAGKIGVGGLNGNQGAGTINLDGTGSTLNQTGASSLYLGNADTPGNGGVHTINVTNSAVFTTGTGTTTIRKTGTLNVNTGGIFNANGDLNLIGGTINADHTHGALINPTGLLFPNGSTLTASANAQINITGTGIIGYDLQNGATFNLTDGADLTVTNGEFDVGQTTDGTLIVDGAGTTFSAAANSDIGVAGGTGVATFRNSATGSFNSLDVSGSINSTGTLSVESDAQVTVGSTLVVGETGTVRIHDGTLTANGAMTIAGGTLHKVLSDYGQPIITTTAGLTIDSGSTLKIELANGFVPVENDAFLLISSVNDITAGFTTIEGRNIGGGLYFDTFIFDDGPGQTMELQVFQAAVADLDFDGDVDDADFGIAFAAFTGPNLGPPNNANADLDNDGDVDDADFGIAFAAFTGPGAPANVPEPASLALFGLGGLALLRRSRRG